MLPKHWIFPDRLELIQLIAHKFVMGFDALRAPVV